MIIRCTKCSTEFALDPSQVGPEGVTLRCSVCSHMFHAEPDPEAVPAPWKLATVEKHLFTLPDLRAVIEHVQDGRLRPEDQISRTGQSFIKLGEMPELSTLFAGAEGLPRVFRAMESSPAGDLGPPPAFGHNTDEVRREETVRFAVGGSGIRRPTTGDDPLPAPPDFDSALPAPPDFDTPVARRGRGAGPEPRSFSATPGDRHPERVERHGPGHLTTDRDRHPPDRHPERGPARPAPASMLEAVTKAVTGEEHRRERDIPDQSEASRTRSQPILIADLARAAAATAEKAVQAVDGQRARERAERSTGTFTGSMTRVDPSRQEPSSRIARPASSSGYSTIPPGGMNAPTQGHRETANLQLAAAAARAAELAAQKREAEPTQPARPVDDESPGGETAELTRPPEVVIVKMPESRRSSAPLVGLLAVAAALGLVFGVPSIRERVFNLGGPLPGDGTQPTTQPAVADTGAQELEQARKAIRNLGFKESNKVQATLQRVIDDPARSPTDVAQTKLTLAELVLMRALACKIAVTLEPAAMGGQAQTRSAEDPIAAQDLLSSLGEGADPQQLQRVRVLQALVEGKTPGELPPDSEELAALIKGAGLWRGELRTPPSGLITSLQRLANPSSLSQSVLALALWRSGDVEGARTLLQQIVDRVGDQPAAKTMLEALDRQDMLTENGDPEAAVPPSDPEPEPTPEPAPEPAPEPNSPDARTPRPPAGAPIEKVEVLISTGCQKVRQGDPSGVRLLLDAVDRGADATQNFNLCFCLAAGFARQNNHDVAFSWYKRAVQVSPSNRDAIAGAARSAELLGRTNTAVDYYKRLRAIEPNNQAAATFLARHAPDSEPAPPVEEPPGELMPIKPKNR